MKRLTAIDGLNGPDWFDVFKETHKAHLNFAAGNQAAALESIENAYAQDQGAVRVIDTLARLLAVNGKPDEGLKILWPIRYPLPQSSSDRRHSEAH